MSYVAGSSRGMVTATFTFLRFVFIWRNSISLCCLHWFWTPRFKGLSSLNFHSSWEKRGMALYLGHFHCFAMLLPDHKTGSQPLEEKYPYGRESMYLRRESVPKARHTRKAPMEPLAHNHPIKQSRWVFPGEISSGATWPTNPKIMRNENSLFFYMSLNIANFIR